MHQLCRKGIRSVIVERSESLRATGSAIAIFSNGWRALDQLGVASKLRPTAIPIHALHEVSLDDNSGQKTPLGNVELRCLKRTTLIETLSKDLPIESLRSRCQVIAVKLDPITSYPILQIHNGTIIKAKVVVGCDGANSVVSEFLGLKPTKLLSTCSVVGFTNYPDGHGLNNESVRMRRGNILVGRIPMDDKLVYWFVGRKWTPQDSNVSKDPESIKQSAMESISDFPDEIVEMVRKSDANSLILTQLRYRALWDILFGGFRKGRVTVAGDAMHVIAPFLGQGSSAALEDAVVLARCLAQEKNMNMMMTTRVEKALDQYVKQRKMRLVWLSTQTYLVGLLLEPSSMLVHFVCLALLIVLFRDSLGHTHYDCGHL